MSEASEAQGGAAQVLDTAVDGFGGAVASIDMIEVLNRPGFWSVLT
jgi:hypothetical protein